MLVSNRIMPLPGYFNGGGGSPQAAEPVPQSQQQQHRRSRSQSVGRKKSNTMLQNASAEELSVLVLTIQDEYAKLSQEKASADDTIGNLNQQYKDAMDEICSLSSKMHDLAVENEEVRSMMETQSVEFEKSASEIASIESLKRESDQALMQSEAQTTAMREALVGEISRLTAQLSTYSREVEELQEEKEALELENSKMHQDLILARRDAERARLEGTMSSEELTQSLQDTEARLTSELEQLQHKFDIERNVVDQQKAHIDNLESELEGHHEDSDAAALSYEAAISELKSRLDESAQEGGERKELAQRADRAEKMARQLDVELKEICMDMDARREEYELRESKLTAEMEKLREQYERQLSNMTKEYNEQLIQTVALQKELDQTKTELDALEGDNADLQDTINVMENNMAAVRNDFSSRSETAREDAMAQKEEYEMQLDRLHNELEEKKEELKKACHQNDLTKDTILKLEQDLEGKIMMLDKATAEQQSTREMYENRIDRMRAESLNTKEIHMKEMGDLLKDNEIMKKELDDERMQKRSAEYRVRRLEEEMEMGKELLEQAKKDAESSKEEYEHVMEGVMDKMNDAKDDAFAKGEEIDELRTQLRKAEIDKNRADDRLELVTADKEEAELNANKLQEQIDATIRDYETRIDNVTMKYLDKIEKLNKNKADMEDQLHELQDEHDNATSNLKSTLEELSSSKFAYERRIENLEKDLDSTVQTLDRKIKSLEDEINKVHDENDGLARERQKLMVHIRNLETDRDEAINARRSMDEQLNVEREEHDAAIDQTKNNFSQVIDKLMAERKELNESLNQVENDLSERENRINDLLQEMNNERRSLEGKIARLSNENDEINRNILVLSSQRKEAMEKIRGLEGEVSDADGAIDDAKAAIEALLEEKKTLEDTVSDLKNERMRVDQTSSQLRNQLSTMKKEQESKLFKVQEENDELNHSMIVLKVEKKDALEKISNLENEIDQAETVIGDAKNALQKLICDKDDAVMRIENLEEDLAHAQSTIDAMTKSMSEARQEYEAKIDSLMSGLATAREVHASRSIASSSESDYSRLDTRSTVYSIPERRSQYGGSKETQSFDSYGNTNSSAIKSILDDSRSNTRRDSAVASRTLVPYREERKRGGLTPSLDNESMTTNSESIDRSSASSSLRARSAGRSRNEFNDTTTEDSKKPTSAHRHSRSDSNKLSNLDLARTFLSESDAGGSSTSRASSRTRSRAPQDRDTFDDSKSVARTRSRYSQDRDAFDDSKSAASTRSRYSHDRDTFDDSKSVGGQSLGGKSRSSGSRGFGGKYDGDLNSQCERDGYGVFVADNGNTYKGEWKNDKRHGHGEALYNTGDMYIGSWMNCKRHGHGTMHIENGDVYEGGWNNGFKDGPGTYRWRDGEVDVSRYSSDYRVGEGVRWSADRNRAFRLVRGNIQDEIDLGEADQIASGLGLPTPS